MMQFVITDVFAEAPLSGNQLATVLDAGHLDTDSMQRIAREFNFSETTFITGGDVSSGFDVRIFTPTSELPFAGHPTLGTAHVIRKELLESPVDELTLNLGVGPIRVSVDNEILWMRQHPPVFGETLAPDVVAEGLGIAPHGLDEFPAQFVSTGLEFLLVPVRDLQVLRAIDRVDERLAHGVLVFCPESYEPAQSVAARMFALEMGVGEDPATGSANGCLAAYIVEHGYLGGDAIDIRVGQGYEIGRPSCLYLRARKSGDEIEVNVGGKVHVVAAGTLYA